MRNREGNIKVSRSIEGKKDTGKKRNIKAEKKKLY